MDLSLYLREHMKFDGDVTDEVIYRFLSQPMIDPGFLLLRFIEEAAYPVFDRMFSFRPGPG